jgi:hypothetical protein
LYLAVIKLKKDTGFSSSAFIYSLVIDGYVLPVVVFTVIVHQFLRILLLQREANRKRDRQYYQSMIMSESQSKYVNNFLIELVPAQLVSV